MVIVIVRLWRWMLGRGVCGLNADFYCRLCGVRGIFLGCILHIICTWTGACTLHNRVWYQNQLICQFSSNTLQTWKQHWQTHKTQLVRVSHWHQLNHYYFSPLADYPPYLHSHHYISTFTSIFHTSSCYYYNCYCSPNCKYRYLWSIARHYFDYSCSLWFLCSLNMVCLSNTSFYVDFRISLFLMWGL